MKVLIISSNSLPAAPTGPVYVAGAARSAGHDVRIYDRLFAKNLESELSGILVEFQPDVVGVSIRFVFDDELDQNAPLGTRHTDLRPSVKEITDIVKRFSNAPIVLGGPGFTYYARDWLEYLDLDYGIRGEAEISFPLYLQYLANDGDTNSVPGCISRKGEKYHSIPPQLVEDLDHQALPAYDLLDWQSYADQKITPAILTKRGCAYSCTFCPYCKLEGRRYRLKSAQRILSEVSHIVHHTNSTRVMFCENNFNAPRHQSEEICRAIINAKVDIRWGTGDLRPAGITPEFCQLMEDSGCFYVNLSIESASEQMLRSMKRGYTVRDVRKSLQNLSKSNIPFGASLMLGSPGETPETIMETLQVLDEFTIPLGVWVTIGIYLWTDLQDIVAEAKQAGILQDDRELFTGFVYLSPGLPKSYLRTLPDMLRGKPDYFVQFNKPSESWKP